MSHGDRVTKLPPPASVWSAAARAPPFAAIADEARRFYGVQFHPRGASHTRTAGSSCATSPTGVAGLSGGWSMKGFRQAEIDRIRAPRFGQGRGDLRPLRRRRQLGRCRNHPRGDRRPAHLHLRRFRALAARRSRRGGSPISRPLQHQADSPATPPTSSSVSSRASPIPRPSARPSAACSSRCSRRRRPNSAVPTSSPRARSIRT